MSVSLSQGLLWKGNLEGTKESERERERERERESKREREREREAGGRERNDI
jgi:hypothetical protein